MAFKIQKCLKKLFGRRRLLFLTGAGTSIPFDYPSTQAFTTLIGNHFQADPFVRSNPQYLAIFNQICSDLQSYFKNPGIVTFENIYQAIQDVMVIKSIPTDPKAYDEFRPHVGASHELKSQYSGFSVNDARVVQTYYLSSMLQTFLSQLSAFTNTAILDNAIKYLEKKYVLNSFTLNYDDLIRDYLTSHVTGFTSGASPRVFNQNLLLSAIDSKQNTHSHLHGSLRWGFPSKNAFEIHEYDSPSQGVQASISRPSGRPAQRGETLPMSPIITGMDKTELVFRKTFYSNFLAFFRSLEMSTDLLIAGYGLSDRHVNMGIKHCRINRPDVRTYIVDHEKTDLASEYIQRLSPDAWRTILPGPRFNPRPDGWWKIPGINSSNIQTSKIFLWLKGFDTFCVSLCKNGLPK